MLLSRNSYAWADATLERARVISPSWIVKRVRTHGVLDDERPLSVMGRETTSTRSRLSLLLEGQGAAFAGDRAWPFVVGEALLVTPFANVFDADIVPSTWLEVEWDAGPQAAVVEKHRINERLLATARELAGRLSEPEMIGARIAASTRDLFDRLRAEGFGPFDAEPLRAIDSPSQLALEAVDAVLSDLRAQPQMVDLEARLSCSRWTLARSIRTLSEKYGLFGVGGGADWRSMRDFTRLRVAGIFMSHPQASTGHIARSVGYQSAEAMCHAFAKAGLPSPGCLRDRRAARL